MFVNKIFIACLSFWLFTACNKEPDELPPATQTGANTFGAKIDGKKWVPRGFGIFPASNLLEARFITPTSIIINARNFGSSPNETEFELLISDVTGPGTYLLNNNVTLPAYVSYGYYFKRRFTPTDEWLTSSTYTGTVTITKLDVVAKIISGTFEFNAISIFDTPLTISVTEGRFDIELE